MPELMSRLPLSEIGGAKVFRPCTIGGVLRRRGDVVSADELLKVNASNLRSLIDQRFIQVWRAADEAPRSKPEPGEVMIVPRAGAPNRYDVVVGRRVNGGGGLTKADADRLAARVGSDRTGDETAAA